MRILILNDLGTPTGGAELMSASLRDSLRERGHEAILMTSTAGMSKHGSIADETCYGSPSAFGTVLKTASPLAAWKVRKVIRRFKPDIVHVRMFMTQLSPAILPLLKNIPSIYHAVSHEMICPTVNNVLPDGSECKEQAGRACRQCLSPQAWTLAMAQRKLFKRWMGAFDAIVANSEGLREQLESNGFENVKMIFNGVPSQPERPPLSNPPTVTYAGRLTSEKGPQPLVKAMAQVVNRIPNAQLIVAGDGPQSDMLRLLADELGIAESITWLGWIPRDDMGKALESGWVHVVPSLARETFGLTCAEAMLRGSPVVAANHGGLADQVLDGKTGFLTPPGDVAAMAEAIQLLLLDQKRCEEMGRAARSRALDQFTITRCVDQFESLYEQMLTPS